MDANHLAGESNVTQLMETRGKPWGGEYKLHAGSSNVSAGSAKLPTSYCITTNTTEARESGKHPPRLSRTERERLRPVKAGKEEPGITEERPVNISPTGMVSSKVTNDSSDNPLYL